MTSPLTPSTLVDDQDWTEVFQHVARGEEEVDGHPPKSASSANFPTPPLTPVSPRSLGALSQSFPSDSTLVAGDSDTTIVSVSTTFHPSAGLLSTIPPDLVLLSADLVFFYVHEPVLLAASNNKFGSLLPLATAQSKLNSSPAPFKPTEDEPIQLLVVPEPSAVLNVVLHIVYGLSPARHSPSYTTLAAAVNCMPTYGIALRPLLNPSSKPHVGRRTPPPPPSHLYTLLVSHAPAHALELYTLAAAHDIPELARAASAYLHGLRVCEIPDEAVLRMGGVYFARLVRMQLLRIEVLKRAVVQPPKAHAPTRTCTEEDTARLVRAWGLVAASLVWDAVPDSSVVNLEASFRALSMHLTCLECAQELNTHLNTVLKIWAQAPKTATSAHQAQVQSGSGQYQSATGPGPATDDFSSPSLCSLHPMPPMAMNVNFGNINAGCSYLRRLRAEWRLSSYGLPEYWLRAIEKDADSIGSNKMLNSRLKAYDLGRVALLSALYLLKHRLTPLAEASQKSISDDPESLSADFQLVSCRNLLRCLLSSCLRCCIRAPSEV
ncbi:hypothetical protein HGRIS_001814 [Hohenbuehelia grisea]|uniref:BTB domain-containing protein n=1 Tax=Hohenbuehelia grisea TaxID=104357 RepID=A0ABR3JJJ1_9AGAR